MSNMIWLLAIPAAVIAAFAVTYKRRYPAGEMETDSFSFVCDEKEILRSVTERIEEFQFHIVSIDTKEFGESQKSVIRIERTENETIRYMNLLTEIASLPGVRSVQDLD